MSGISPSGFSDKELVKHALTGQQEAFAELRRRYEQAVYNWALGKLGNHHDAEQAVQDAFWKAFNKLDSFRFESSFGTWLREIVSRAAIDIWRERLRRHRAEVQASKCAGKDCRRPHDALVARDWRALVARILRRHAVPLDRLVLRLHYDEGFTYPEIAEVFGMRDESGMLDDEKPRTIVGRQLRILKRHLPPEHRSI